ncbi:GNAT family acetyltransferase [Photobacterium jeanii]|uniref:GNAT family acetyltransferase n=1 Tax=Photobacterium jeanii TaxID=858640 RepID=A0A178K740_9GAMM|nr:GNAT family N-acetyltransferase [Photobacterium jeanii]OAN13159.1 GNAT family acetyltransferase [Photobacterium jeanii]PST89310.1 N-acetyltransferase [Photobacterium jeanii]
MELKLEKVTPHNLREVINLELEESQKSLLSPNVFSMAQAAVNPKYQPRAAVINDEVVGFVMYSEWLDADWAKENKPGEYYIFRVMTDKAYQGKGYGRKLMKAVIAEIEANNPKSIHIGYCEENTVARKFYATLGFIEYGNADWGDIMAAKSYS